MRESIGGMMIRKMIEAAEANMREEKIEMKNTTTEPKTYNCAVSLSTEYVITANTPEEARDKAAMKFMAEATDDTPHELFPLVEIKEANAEPDDTDMWAELIQEEKAGIEEDDLDWDYEEDKEEPLPYHYRYYEEDLGIESDSYEFGFEMVADIVEKFRLTVEEKAELERKVALLQFGDSDTLTLPYAEIIVTLLDK